MTIKDEMAEFVKTLPLNYVFTNTWFRKTLHEKYGRPQDSYIPSDYCFNRKNKGIDYEKQPHYFLYLKRNQYQYVSENYNFNGNVEDAR